MVDKEKNQFIARQLTSLGKVYELHKQIKDIDTSLSQLYPITIIKDNTFYVFDLDVTEEKYEFKLEYPTPMEIPKGVLAAFPLEFYDMKASAIVFEDAFNNLEGYVFIFHEFVHCFQWQSCENEIRALLEIEGEAKKENNFMWEITHPFPYDNMFFIEKTVELNNYLNTNDYEKVLGYHREMMKYLNRIDFEYMIWQEWKEGYARYVENKIRGRINTKTNTNKLQTPFDRRCFYEIGSKYIELLIDNNYDLKGNIKELYFRMVNLA